MTMRNRAIIQGATHSWDVTFKDKDGVGIDFTFGTRYAKLRMRKLGADSVALTIDTDTSDEFAWTDESAGEGTWTISKTASLALAAGEYYADVTYYDETNGKTYPVGEARYFVEAPTIGAL